MEHKKTIALNFTYAFRGQEEIIIITIMNIKWNKMYDFWYKYWTHHRVWYQYAFCDQLKHTNRTIKMNKIVSIVLIQLFQINPWWAKVIFVLKSILKKKHKKAKVKIQSWCNFPKTICETKKIYYHSNIEFGLNLHCFLGHYFLCHRCCCSCSSSSSKSISWCSSRNGASRCLCECRQFPICVANIKWNFCTRTRTIETNW